VIAIIAILAAILFPVFAKVREKARQTSCLSNEKQLGLAFIQYVQDYDEHYPAGVPGLSAHCANNTPGEGWAFQVYPYVKSTGAYICPDDSSPNQFGEVSYAFNDNVSGNTDSILAAPASTVILFEANGNAILNTQGQDPSQTLAGVVGDCYLASYDPDVSGQGSYFPGAPNIDSASGHLGGRLANTISPRHTGGSNFLAADGHAKWLRPETVSSGAITSSGTSSYQDQNGTYQAATTDNLSLNAAGTTKAALTFSTL